MHVGHAGGQADDFLRLVDAELVGHAHRVVQVAAGVGDADHVGAGALRLQHEGGEVGGAHGVVQGAEHFTAGVFHRLGGVVFDGFAERVVHRHEVPAVVALFGDGAAQAVGQGVGVPGVEDGVGRALLVVDGGGAGAGDHQHAVLVAGHFGHRQGHRGVDHVGDHVHAFGVVPLAGAAGGHVGFVLVVGGDHLHLEAGFLLGDEVVRRHARGGDGAFAAQVGEDAGHVRQHADFHGVAGDALGVWFGTVGGAGHPAGEQGDGEEAGCYWLMHDASSFCCCGSDRLVQPVTRRAQRLISLRVSVVSGRNGNRV